jgi:hypothetical protein
MPEYRVHYCKIPTNYNDDRLMFVEADTPEEALKKARNQCERQTRTPSHDYVWGKPTEAEQ